MGNRTILAATGELVMAGSGGLVIPTGERVKQSVPSSGLVLVGTGEEVIQSLGAPTTFQLTDTATACAVGQYCGNAGPGLLADGRQATKGGTAGTGTTALLCDPSSTELLVQYELIIPAGASWLAGTWTVKLNQTVASGTNLLTLDSIQICRVSSGCVNQAQIGSLTGINLSMNATGVITESITGSAQTPAAGDKVVIVWNFKNADTINNRGFTYKHDQIQSSPILS